MALTAQPTGHTNWGRWPQQMAHEYGMMDAQGLMVYGSRPQSPDMMHGHMMAPTYMMAPQYNPAHLQPMPAPHYHGSYGPYDHSGHLVPASMPFKPEYQAHPDARLVAQPALMAREDVKPCLINGHLSPPSSRRGSEICTEQQDSNPNLNSKTITANETLDPKDRIDFATDVDQLMKAIQTDECGNPSDAQTFTPMASPKLELISAHSSPASSAMSPCPSSQGTSKPKKYFCDGPNCNKGFSQKTHLDIHKRTHTGKRPYVCSHEGCKLTFSQLGNLKTHERRHTGERPYKCGKCDKTFAQKGNVKSHEETHEGKKPFRCLLEGCDKRFSQLGNMKTHQNNFHKEALQDLTSKFVKFTTEGYIPEEYRTLFDYFKLHYKNSNKGIKGRGKARKIAARETRTASRKASSSKAVTQESRQPSQEPIYTMTSSHSHMVNNIPRTSNFGPAFAVDSHNPNPGHMLYQDEHARQMGFGERLY